MNRQPTLHTIETTTRDAGAVESLFAAGLGAKRRWLWVRCAGEPGSLSSELVATVSIPDGSGDGTGGAPSHPEAWTETQVWCSYRSPADVYRLVAELMRSGVTILEVRKLSPDVHMWPIDGVVGTCTIAAPGLQRGSLPSRPTVPSAVTDQS